MTGAIDKGLVYIPKSELKRRKIDLTAREFRAVPAKKSAGHAPAPDFEIFHDTGDGVLVPRFLKIGDSLHETLDILQLPVASKLPFRRGPDSDRYSTPVVLRKNQINGSAEAIAYLNNNDGVIIDAPCGSGKTTIALRLLAVLRPEKTVILVDQVDIANQWLDRIHKELPNIAATIWGKKGSLADVLEKNQIVITTAQKLWRHELANSPVQADFLIVDEVHVFSAPKFFGSIRNVAFSKSLGLSATPDRKDALEWLFKAVLGAHMIRIDAAALKSKICAVNVTHLVRINQDHFNMAFCKTFMRMTWEANCKQCRYATAFPECGGGIPYDKVTKKPSWGTKLNYTGLVKNLIDQPAYNDYIVDLCFKLIQKKRNVIVFSQLVDHLQLLARLASMRAKSDDEFASLFGFYGGTARFKKSDMKVHEQFAKPVTFASYKIAEKALDVPHKDTIILASPNGDIRQCVGRIERMMPGKPTPVVFDLVIDSVPVFYGLHRKRMLQYTDRNLTITRK